MLVIRGPSAWPFYPKEGYAHQKDCVVCVRICIRLFQEHTCSLRDFLRNNPLSMYPWFAWMHDPECGQPLRGWAARRGGVEVRLRFRATLRGRLPSLLRLGLNSSLSGCEATVFSPRRSIRASSFFPVVPAKSVSWGSILRARSIRPSVFNAFLRPLRRSGCEMLSRNWSGGGFL